jgi:hypothetical protein
VTTRAATSPSAANVSFISAGTHFQNVTTTVAASPLASDGSFISTGTPTVSNFQLLYPTTYFGSILESLCPVRLSVPSFCLSRPALSSLISFEQDSVEI